MSKRAGSRRSSRVAPRAVSRGGGRRAATQTLEIAIGHSPRKLPTAQSARLGVGAKRLLAMSRHSATRSASDSLSTNPVNSSLPGWKYLLRPDTYVCRIRVCGTPRHVPPRLSRMGMQHPELPHHVSLDSSPHTDAKPESMAPPGIARSQPGGEARRNCAAFRRIARRWMPSAPPRLKCEEVKPGGDRVQRGATARQAAWCTGFGDSQIRLDHRRHETAALAKLPAPVEKQIGVQIIAPSDQRDRTPG